MIFYRLLGLATLDRIFPLNQRTMPDTYIPGLSRINSASYILCIQHADFNKSIIGYVWKYENFRYSVFELFHIYNTIRILPTSIDRPLASSGPVSAPLLVHKAVGDCIYPTPARCSRSRSPGRWSRSPRSHAQQAYRHGGGDQARGDSRRPCQPPAQRSA